jgi:hypothetical protein
MYEIIKRSADDADFEKALFVIRAISDDETRPFLCVLHVEGTRSGTRLVATDGHRLHVSEIEAKIPSGDYKTEVTKSSVILRGPVTDVNYPNWRRVVPMAANVKGKINFEKTGIGHNFGQCAGMSIAFSQVIEKTGEVVNLRYLEDLPKKEWSVLSQEGKHCAIMFKRENQGKEDMAVIMPMDTAA